MTITALPEVADGRPSCDAGWRDSRSLAGHVTVGLALVWWAFVLTHGTGGRDRWLQTIGIALAVAALVAVRPWLVVRAVDLVLAAAVATAPVVVCLVDPTHWFGASQAASYAYAALLFVTVRAYAVTSARRLALVGLFLGAAVAQVAWAMIPWVGGGDPSVALVGTFYWHNQLAAFLLAPVVLGAGLAAIGTGPLRLAGMVAAILSTAGIVLSTSRASMALLALAWVAAAALALLSASALRSRAFAAGRVLGLGAVAALVTVLLPGPPLFAHRVAALAATSARAQGQSLDQNGGYRIDFWRQALKVFGHHPVTGGGFGSFGRLAAEVDPHGAHSALVHSGLLQPLTDGGLVLGLPVLLAVALVGLGLVRRLLPSAWRADQGAVTLLALGALLLLAHSAVDFDWTYPSLLAMSAVVAGAALASSPSAPAAEPTGSRTAVVACALMVGASLVLAQQAIPAGLHLTAPTPQSTSLSGVPAS